MNNNSDIPPKPSSVVITTNAEAIAERSAKIDEARQRLDLLFADNKDVELFDSLETLWREIFPDEPHVGWNVEDNCVLVASVKNLPKVGYSTSTGAWYSSSDSNSTVYYAIGKDRMLYGLGREDQHGFEMNGMNHVPIMQLSGILAFRNTLI